MQKIAYVIAALWATSAFGQAVSPHDLPDPKLTPGLANTAMTKAVICNKTWHTKDVRSVTAAMKHKVYVRYGMAKPRTGYCKTKQGCEVDHLISLELGGANDVANLWPQPYSGTPWNAHRKDKYENYLHRQVCAGAIALVDAQRQISRDWVAGYRAAGFK